MSGAFYELEEIIKKRLHKQTIGFEADVSSKKSSGRYLKHVKAEDLIQYGFESEFIGRLPVIACLDELSVKDLYSILQNPNNSVVVGKKLDFLAYDIRIQFDNEALMEIAEKAANEHTGARGLVSVMERTLLPFEKKLPSTDIKYLTIHQKLTKDPSAELNKLLSDPEHRSFHEDQYHILAQEEHDRLQELIISKRQKYLHDNEVKITPTMLNLMAKQCQDQILDISDACEIFVDIISHIKECEKNISAKCGIHVTFSEDAIDRILARHPLKQSAIHSLCETLATTFEYGFGLLQQKKGIDQVVIPVSGIDNPELYINDLVRNAFRE